MALSKQTALEYVDGVLGGEIQSIGPLRLLNMAGEHMVNMRPWSWLERAETSFDLVAGQPWIALPGNFRDLQSISTPSASLTTLHPTDEAGLQRLRDDALVVANDLWYCVRRALVDGVVVTRLEIWPTPEEDQTAYGTLYYKAGWETITDLHEDTYLLPVADYADGLFLRVLRAHAIGFDEEDEETGRSLEVLLAEIERSEALAAVWRRDQAAQYLHGPRVGGYAQVHWQEGIRDWEGFAEAPS